MRAWQLWRLASLHCTRGAFTELEVGSTKVEYKVLVAYLIDAQLLAKSVVDIVACHNENETVTDNQITELRSSMKKCAEDSKVAGLHGVCDVMNENLSGSAQAAATAMKDAHFVGAKSKVEGDFEEIQK